MSPQWLNLLSIASLCLAAASALVLIADEVRHPQRMPIMNLVWPVTALYLGPIAVWAYWAMGRMSAKDFSKRQGHPGKGKPFWQLAAVAVAHCGAGCTLGDIAGEWLVFMFALAVFNQPFYAMISLDFGLAYVLGIVIQYRTIAPMRGLGIGEGIVAALKADSLSLLAFEVGLFGWMAIMHKVLFPGIHPDSPTYWFLMQIGMALGFLTAYPVNGWLLRSGLKEPM